MPSRSKKRIQSFKIKQLLLYFFLILFLANIVVFGAGYIKKNGFPVIFSQVKNHTQNTKSSTFVLPLSVDRSNVSSVYLVYNFFGPILEVKKVPTGTQIILLTAQKNDPQFIITDKDTKLYTVGKDNVPVSTTVDSLENEKSVTVSMTYDLRSHEWVTRTVYIFDATIQ